MARGGPVPAPGDPERALQVIDVRDFAAFGVHVVGAGPAGRYITTAPAGNVTFRGFLPASIEAVSEPAARRTGLGGGRPAARRGAGWRPAVGRAPAPGARRPEPVARLARRHRPAGRYRPDAPHGYGLVVIDRIADDWGAAQTAPSRRCGRTSRARTDPGAVQRAARANPGLLFDN
ncbi:hypothetical protein [Kitasatospora sp. NPDC051914]|uniref:hypothetical protein n=1 Tax=Kitasatospora sp. NPDC051914 TaxID=3154945 RepID=UPI003421F276